MQTSQFIAALMGPVILAAALAALVNPDHLRGMIGDFLANRALIFISGVMALGVGLAVVNTHNVWSADWRVMITLFGWAMVVSGVMRIVAPVASETFGARLIEMKAMAPVVGAVWLMVGVYLTYKGYF